MVKIEKNARFKIQIHTTSNEPEKAEPLKPPSIFIQSVTNDNEMIAGLTRLRGITLSQ
mgnify:CR=1 FL=1